MTTMQHTNAYQASEVLSIGELFKRYEHLSFVQHGHFETFKQQNFSIARLMATGQEVMMEAGPVIAGAYRGGIWEFKAINKDAFYMCPQNFGVNYFLSWSGNGFEGAVSPDAAGLIFGAMSTSWLTFRPELFTEKQLNEIIEMHYHIKDAICKHPEVQQILSAID